MNTVDVLIAARKLIEREENWGKGGRHFERPIETCCAAEAIEHCADGETRKQAFNIFRLANGISNKWGAVVGWNDAPERAHSEVLQAFDKAIAAERAKESA